MNKQVENGGKPNSYHPGIYNLLKTLIKETLCGLAIVIIIAIPAVIIKVLVKLYEVQKWSDEWIVLGLNGLAYFIFAVDLLVAASIITALGFELRKRSGNENPKTACQRQSCASII